jgi:hypothetical protein
MMVYSRSIDSFNRMGADSLTGLDRANAIRLQGMGFVFAHYRLETGTDYSVV